MKRIIALMLALVIGAAIFAGCGKSAEADPAAAGYVEKPVGKVNGAALYNLDEKLLDYISERQSGNFVFSPLSFKYAYALMLAGAEGNTKKELLDAFKLNNGETLEALLESFYEFADKYDNSKGFHYGEASAEEAEKMRFALKIANSVWTHEDSDGVKDEYKKKIKKYNAEYFEFSGNVSKKLNEWVSENTNGMIPKMLPDDYDADGIVMMLVNALYFKGVWEEAFKENNTTKAMFTTASGKEVEKSFMMRSDKMSYYSDDDTQLVILPMQGNTAMAFVLGSTENIADKLEKAVDRNVNLAVPKFKVETSLENRELCDFLRACGVSDAFGAADFSGMTDEGGIYIEDIIQRAKLTIDEKGVEGAAATDIIYLGAVMGEYVNFTADRPFSFFVIADAETERYVLFEGKIVE